MTFTTSPKAVLEADRRAHRAVPILPARSARRMARTEGFGSDVQIASLGAAVSRPEGAVPSECFREESARGHCPSPHGATLP